MEDLTLSAQRDALAAGTLSAVDLVSDCLARIEAGATAAERLCNRDRRAGTGRGSCVGPAHRRATPSALKACRLRTRTFFVPTVCERPAVRACWSTSYRPTTPPWWRDCVTPAPSWSARPTWTNSPWARPMKPVILAMSPTRGISSAHRGGPPVARRRRWLPGWSRAPPAPTPAARSASRRRCVVSPGLSRPTVAYRATA